MSDPETYEVFAIKYGDMNKRFRRDNFIMADDHDVSMPIDYFVWAIRNQNRTIVIDTGFEQEEAKRRGRQVQRTPAEGLEMLGIDAAQVEDVVLTHLHYDHAGTLGDFPAARFHIQDREVNYATGRHMCHDPFGHAYSADHVCQLVRKVFDKKVQFHDGDAEIAPGISLHLIGGHTMGVQCVRVFTKRGWVVLASDASHFYENMQREKPFPIVYSLSDMIAGYGKMRKLADSDDHIVPGHDPQVLQFYPAEQKSTAGIICRLDEMPKK